MERLHKDRAVGSNPAEGRCSARAGRASIGSGLRPAIARTFAGPGTASHSAAGGWRNPGCESTAQFLAARENCVTPEHFLLAGLAI